jgi:glycosyltransferase involved in cell wall biosynthesis
MKVLVELRPALDGHAGIPQETRLLFRTLAALADVEVQGLIQSSNKVLPRSPDARQGDAASRIDAQSRVVVALQQNEGLSRPEWLLQLAQRVWLPALQMLATMLGLRKRLGHFDATHFGDFVWRAFFAKTLPPQDKELVTSQRFRVARVPWSALHVAALLTRRLGAAMYPRLDTRGIDALVVETPYPGRVLAPTRLVVRYHDAIPLLLPHTISKRRYHQAAHYHALRRNVKDGAWFACVSEATRRDLVSVFPQAEARAVVIPNMVSHHFHEEPAPATRVPEIVWSRSNRSAPHGGGAPIADGDLRDGRLEYLLVVSTIEPRKNHLTVIEAWERLRTEGHPGLNLVFVGSLGWEHGAILRRIAPWLERGGLHLLQDVPSDDLRLLYRHAAATVCPSYYEGFDFAGVEAMASGGAVLASDIAVHREVYDDAAIYFDPYASASLVSAYGSLLQAGRREQLQRAGAAVSARYTPAAVAPQWAALLERIGPRQ